MGGQHDVCNGLSFDLANPGTRHIRTRLRISVKHDVGKLVNECLGGLGVIDVVAYPDFTLGHLGDTVRAVEGVDRTSHQSVSAFTHLGDQVLQQPGR